MRKTCWLAMAVALSALSLAHAETVVVEREYAKLRKGPGSFYEVAGLVRKGAALAIEDKDDQGRWLKISGVFAKSATEGDKLVAIEQPKDAQETWIAKITASKPQSEAEVARAAGTPDAIKVDEALTAASIRGLDDDVEKLLAYNHADPELAAWMLKPRFEPKAYIQFRAATLPASGFVPLALTDEAAEEPLNVVITDKLGLVIAAKLSAAMKGRVVRDEALTGYVHMVATLVAEATAGYDVTYRVVIVDEKAINSFSTPGGFLVVTTGLLRACTNEAQLAAALAHEIAHVARGHGLRERESVARELGADVVGAFRELEGSARSSRMGQIPQYEELRDMADWFYSVTIAKPRRVQEEHEADVHGLVYLYRAGYDPSAFVEFLQSAEDTRGILFNRHPLRNHALPGKRVKSIESYITRLQLTQNAGRTFEARYQEHLGAFNGLRGDK